MRLLVKIYLAAAAVCCLSFAAAGAGDEADDGASAPVDGTFFDQVFEGWDKLIDAYGRGYSAKGEFQARGQGDGPSSRSSLFSDIFYHRIYYLVVTHDSYPEDHNGISARNRRYSFDVKAGEDGKYKLDSIKKNSSAVPKREENFCLLLQGCHLNPLSLESLVRDPSFKITKAADLTDQQSGEKVKEIEFEADFVDPGAQDRVHHGRIQFLPDSYWLIKEYTLFFDSISDEPERFARTCRLSYQTVDSLPFVDKSEEYISFADSTDHPLVTFSIQISDVRPWEPTPERCFLKYYGLRKPMLITPKELLRRALILAAVVLLGLGLFIKFRKPRSGENRSAEDSLSQTE